MLALGADEGDAVLVEDVGEARILGEEPVAGMDRVGAGDLARGEQGGDVEIGIARRRRADADAFVGELDVHRLLVGGRIDRDRGDAELLGRAQHPERDFAAVGDQDLVEHAGRLLTAGEARARAALKPHSMTISAWPYSTGAPSSIMICVSLPDLCATISLNVFIASTSISLSPAFTVAPTSTKGLASGVGRK